MPAKRRIIVLATASALGSALASAAGDNSLRLRQGVIGQPTGTSEHRLSLPSPSSNVVLVDPKQRQVGETVGTEPRDTAAASRCAEDMVEVEGDYCPAAEQICEKWIDQKRDRCERYRTRVRCYGKPRAHHFCIDRYEFPNERGTKPVVAVTWEEASALCTAEGKRICTAEEWTLACEGPERLPHPYGFVRDSKACNFDRPYIMPDDAAYKNPKTRAAEVSRLSQSEPSGARSDCTSPYGVHDMTGNVDEWVLNENGSIMGPEYESGLKGGYWAPVRNRCRPMTTDHNRWHHGYQIGFRCCSTTGTVASSDGLEESTHRDAGIGSGKLECALPPAGPDDTLDGKPEARTGLTLGKSESSSGPLTATDPEPLSTSHLIVPSTELSKERPAERGPS